MFHQDVKLGLLSMDLKAHRQDDVFRKRESDHATHFGVGVGVEGPNAGAGLSGHQDRGTQQSELNFTSSEHSAIFQQRSGGDAKYAFTGKISSFDFLADPRSWSLLGSLGSNRVPMLELVHDVATRLYDEQEYGNKDDELYRVRERTSELINYRRGLIRQEAQNREQAARHVSTSEIIVTFEVTDEALFVTAPLHESIKQMGLKCYSDSGRNNAFASTTKTQEELSKKSQTKFVLEGKFNKKSHLRELWIDVWIDLVRDFTFQKVPSNVWPDSIICEPYPSTFTINKKNASTKTPPRLWPAGDLLDQTCCKVQKAIYSHTVKRADLEFIVHNEQTYLKDLEERNKQPYDY